MREHLGLPPRLAIALLGAALLLPAPVRAAEDGFTIARLKYGGGGDWYSNPSSLPNLQKALRDRTPVEVKELKEARVELMDEALYSYPLLYMNGHGEVRLGQAEVERLRQYLEQGGMLWADDNYGMDRSFRREIARVFPESPLVELPFSHPIFRSFYRLPAGLPKVHEHDGRSPQAFGVFHRGRLAVVYTYESDIGDGIEDPGVHNDSETVREDAMRFAVNVVVYAMTR